MPEKPEVKPNLEFMNDVFVKEVRRLVHEVAWTEEKPVVKEVVTQKEAAGVFYVFRSEGKTAVVEWRSKQGFNISTSKETAFGSDPKSLIMNPYIAAKRVAELLGSGEIVGLIE